MELEFHGRTDVGRMRANNEDSIRLDTDAGLAVLADGMGGYSAGEVASDMAASMITSELARWLAQAGSTATRREVKRAMELCVDNANRAIFEAANTNPDCAGMGTTMVMAVFRGSSVLLGHVGDSRAYRWRDGQLVQLTRDHSLLQEQIDIGLITPEEAAASGNRNLVTRALGVEDAVLMDVGEHGVMPGDVHLLCSDGLTDMVDDHEIAYLLSASHTLADKVDHLIDRANTNGGRDNVSVILIESRLKARKSGMLQKLLGK